MKNDKIHLAEECLGKAIELVAVAPNMYLNGVRQSEPIGYNYEVILREHESDKLRVSIPGKQQMDAPVTGFGTMVTFEGLRVHPYVNRATGQLAFSATASGIKPVNNKT